MRTAEELVSIAVRQLGVREDPPDSNTVRYNTWYYGREVSGKAYPWCMVFVQWCADQTGLGLPIRTASCTALKNAAISTGCWVTENFKPGDIVIYDFSGRKRSPEHCGIVEKVLPDGSVQAVEGNTSVSGSQSNGGMVCRKTRSNRYIVGAVRPLFDKEKKEEDVMTGKEIYDALQGYLAQQPVPDWAKDELREAIAMGITDGKNPMQLIPRYQAAIMAKRVLAKQ